MQNKVTPARAGPMLEPTTLDAVEVVLHQSIGVLLCFVRVNRRGKAVQDVVPRILEVAGPNANARHHHGPRHTHGHGRVDGRRVRCVMAGWASVHGQSEGGCVGRAWVRTSLGRPS